MPGRNEVGATLDSVEVAGDEGIEPSSADLEAAMLPLHQSPSGVAGEIRTRVNVGCSYVPCRSATATVARQVGFEPTTSGSEARRTDPLCYWRVVIKYAASDNDGMEHAEGFEPSPAVWKTAMLAVEHQARSW